jgi:hypothetical protein
MTMDAWKTGYQTVSTPDKDAAFKVAFDENVAKEADRRSCGTVGFSPPIQI